MRSHLFDQDQSESGVAGTIPTSLSELTSTVFDLTFGAPVLSSAEMGVTWYPGTWLTDPDSPGLHELIKVVADQWGGNRHVAAALAFKGYAWATALPVMAGWLRHGCVPMLDSATLRVGIARRLPFVRLDLAAVQVAVPPEDLATAARTSILDGHLREVIAALNAATRIGHRLLWGSVAESVANVAMQLDGGDGARRAMAALGEPVASLVTVTGPANATCVRRHTCCLWFCSEAGRDEYCSSCPVTR